MTWTFQFIIIYIIYSQKLTKKLLQGATQVLDKVELILIQNLAKHLDVLVVLKFDWPAKPLLSKIFHEFHTVNAEAR